GRYAGWLALYSGIAGGGDIILLPEIPYDIDAVTEQIKLRNSMGKNFSIVVVGEGACPLGGEMVVQRTVKNSPEAIRLGGVSHQVARQIEGLTNIECRVTILGHLLRGGQPTANDRLLATQVGVEAVRLVAREEYGRLVVLHNNAISSVSIESIAGKQRRVTPEHPMVSTALALGICLGFPEDVSLDRYLGQLEMSHT
ncbi:MAG: 6-phosphofructokinase, partial [Candidatus Zixiibacteriota bacterium]